MVDMRRFLIFAMALLGAYSVGLVVVELQTSQDFVRNFFTDIEGPVPFFAINTTLSVFLLWATALMFLASIACMDSRPEMASSRWFFFSQVLVFTYLGCDDRFKLHENLAWRLETWDHYVLITVGLGEVALLWFLGRRFLQGRARLFLILACLLFAVMLFFDAVAPHFMPLRLSLEDLAKTWSSLFFFLFAWEIFFDRVRALAGTRGPADDAR